MGFATSVKCFQHNQTKLETFFKYQFISQFKTFPYDLCVMEVLKSLFLVLFMIFVPSKGLHSDGDAFKDILMTLNSTETSLRLENVNSILSTLRLHNCSNATQHEVKANN